MRLIDADKLYPDCMTKDGTLAISQSQIANAPTVESETTRLSLIDDIRQKQISADKAWLEGYEKAKREIPHGKWVELRSYDYKCSLCGNSMMDKWNYCPDCGAQMDLQGEE